MRKGMTSDDFLARDLEVTQNLGEGYEEEEEEE